jgi:hypothetical protein
MEKHGMSRKRARRSRARSATAGQKVTPTHHIRLTRVRVEIDPGRTWYVLRVPGRRETEVASELQSVGFETNRPVQQTYVRRGNRIFEIEARPVAGYVFAGAPGGVDGRSALWAYHAACLAPKPPVSLPDGSGGMVDIQPRSSRGQPFMNVQGPFCATELQRFADQVGPRATGALFEGRNLVLTFPAPVAKILEGERVLLAPPQDDAA